MSLFSLEPMQRKSKQQATKILTEQSRKRQLPTQADGSSSNDVFPEAVYGPPCEYDEIFAPDIVRNREMILNALLKTVSEMYFGCVDPFAEILRCLDERIDPVSRRYVSGLETLLKNEVIEANNSKNKAAREKVIITPLDMLICPFRKQEVLDDWTPFDVTLFELGVCENRGFNPKKIQALFDGRKSLDEVVSFFEEVYAKSDNWKKIRTFIDTETPVERRDEELKSEDGANEVDRKS
jgi:hypothetical protein